MAPNELWFSRWFFKIYNHGTKNQRTDSNQHFFFGCEISHYCENKILQRNVLSQIPYFSVEKSPKFEKKSPHFSTWVLEREVFFFFLVPAF
jgi:hypothetical protein